MKSPSRLGRCSSNRVILEFSVICSDREWQRVCPKKIEGVVVYGQQTMDGETVYVLKHPTTGAFSRLSAEGLFLWQRLDGRHTLKDLTMEFLKKYKTISPETIAVTVTHLV